MRRILQRAALALAAAAVAGWLALGAHLGWTKTTVTRWQKDPVTEIQGPVIERKFEPGLDLLAVCAGGAIALLLASFFIPKTKSRSAKSAS